jgi:hypothetical protein
LFPWLGTMDPINPSMTLAFRVHKREVDPSASVA